MTSEVAETDEGRKREERKGRRERWNEMGSHKLLRARPGAGHVIAYEYCKVKPSSSGFGLEMLALMATIKVSAMTNFTLSTNTLLKGPVQ